MAIVTAAPQLPKASPVEPAKPVEQAAPVAEVPKQEALSPKFAALARQQKEVRRQQEAFKVQQEAFKAQQTQYEQSYITKDKLKQDPMGTLRELGFTDDQIAASMLSQPSPQDRQIKELMSKIEALEAGNKKVESTIQEKEKQAYNQAVGQIRNNVKLLVDGNPEYETIKETGAHEAVVKLIEQTFAENGTIMTNEEAAKEVEEYLLEEALKMANLKKVQAKLAPAVAAPVAPKINAQQPIKTLTNAATAVSSKPLSSKERRERAIAAFKGQLN